MSATDTAYGARLESLVLRPVVSGVVRHGDVSAVAWHGTSAITEHPPRRVVSVQ